GGKPAPFQKNYGLLKQLDVESHFEVTGQAPEVKAFVALQHFDSLDFTGCMLCIGYHAFARELSRAAYQWTNPDISCLRISLRRNQLSRVPLCDQIAQELSALPGVYSADTTRTLRQSLRASFSSGGRSSIQKNLPGARVPLFASAPSRGLAPTRTTTADVARFSNRSLNSGSAGPGARATVCAVDLTAPTPHDLDNSGIEQLHVANYHDASTNCDDKDSTGLYFATRPPGALSRREQEKRPAGSISFTPAFSADGDSGSGLQIFQVGGTMIKSSKKSTQQNLQQQNQNICLHAADASLLDA
ncbi:unnamed protein product, partial [Amoebophrya sp. A25]